MGRGGGEEHMFANHCEGSILCDLCFSGLKFWSKLWILKRTVNSNKFVKPLILDVAKHTIV